jgi:hypothetical protein
MSKDEFVNWWLQTDFGKKNRIRWDARQQSNVWKHFDQVAKTVDGAPEVMCKQCKKNARPPTAAWKWGCSDAKAFERDRVSEGIKISEYQAISPRGTIYLTMNI